MAQSPRSKTQAIRVVGKHDPTNNLSFLVRLKPLKALGWIGSDRGSTFFRQQPLSMFQSCSPGWFCLRIEMHPTSNHNRTTDCRSCPDHGNPSQRIHGDAANLRTPGLTFTATLGWTLGLVGQNKIKWNSQQWIISLWEKIRKPMVNHQILMRKDRKTYG